MFLPFGAASKKRPGAAASKRRRRGFERKAGGVTALLFVLARRAPALAVCEQRSALGGSEGRSNEGDRQTKRFPTPRREAREPKVSRHCAIHREAMLDRIWATLA